MLSDAWRCRCGARNDPRESSCEDCGQGRPVSVQPAPAAERRCVQHGPVDALGACGLHRFPVVVQVGAKWAITSCPYACPRCAGPLGWPGDCGRCHGSATPQDPETWRFPGTRYDLDGDETHWMKTGEAGRPVAPTVPPEWSTLRMSLRETP